MTHIFSSSHDGSVKIWNRRLNIFAIDSVKGRLLRCFKVTAPAKRVLFDKHSLKVLLLFLKENLTLEDVHGSLKILYLAVLSRFDDIVYLAFQLFGFQAWHYIDTPYDPILLALRVDDYVILNALARYLEERPDHHFEISEEYLRRGLACSS